MASSVDMEYESQRGADLRNSVPAELLPNPKANNDSSEANTTTAVERSIYPGSGTAEDPFVVDWDQQDPEDPRQWSNKKRWMLTLQLAFGTWNVSFASSAFSGGLQYTIVDLHTSETVAVLGISLYVLGFGVGPLVFAPLSEMYGRRIVFLFTYTPYLLLHLGGALAQNIQTLVICRFLAGVAGSSPISNAAGMISDMWSPRERGLATALYTMCAFFGPVSGPIVGGFVSESLVRGWRIVFWIMFGLSGLVVVLAFINLSETYPPVLLRRRAKRLEFESENDIRYTSIHERNKLVSKKDIFFINIKRPFVFLIKEPIVTCVSLYISIVYATLYAQFTAYPIVFQEHRHFTPGESGLAFLGIGVGQWIAVASTPIPNRLYWRAMKKGGGKTIPEARLYAAIVGAVALPIGMFWFAWTTFPSIPAIVSILGGLLFGLAMIFIITSLHTYLMDTYGLYCASALASTIFLRSVFAAAFPLFSPPMFKRLGDQWACSVFAFLALACMPIPMFFFKYGSWIRSKSRYAIKTPKPNIPSFELPDSGPTEKVASKEVGGEGRGIEKQGAGQT